MTRLHSVFLSFFVCFSGACFAESFLKAQSFPKTFEDLPFTIRTGILNEGYLPYIIEYDKDGICISGCAYPGLTIIDDMESISEANTEMANLIEQYEHPITETEVPSLDNIEDPALNDIENPALDNTEGPGEVVVVPDVEPTPVQITQDWCRNGKTTKLPLRPPVNMKDCSYYITSDFGFREGSPNGAGLHPAVDIGCPDHKPVYATADGVVETVSFQSKPGGAGLFINIKHDHNLITQYLHLEEALVKKGQKVSACQQIAYSGHSGISKKNKPYGPHLDYRVRFNNNRNKFVDIFCPSKGAFRKENQSTSSNLNGTVDCKHSLFNSPYKFARRDAKNSSWRVKYKHCMTNTSSLLPDENPNIR